jgi:hypothetical protein
MSHEDYELGETLLPIVRLNEDYSIFLLEGERLIVFPA